MKIILSLILIFLAISALAANIAVEWNPSNENIAGYRVHYAEYGCIEKMTCRWISTNVGKKTKFVLRGLNKGKKYLVTVTAYDAAGNESDYAPILEEIAK